MAIIDSGNNDVEQGVKGSSLPAPNDNQTHVAPQDDSDAASIGNQRELMPKNRLLVAFPALSVALFVSFIDQTSVSTSIPAVSSELQTGSATSWIGASFLIAATAFQLVNGRLSDIFGRKNCLLACLGLLALGDILSGFARTQEQLFAFRAIAGVGGGGVNSLAMIIVSDITSFKNRGKYMGEQYDFLTSEMRDTKKREEQNIVPQKLTVLTCNYRNHRCGSCDGQWHRPFHWRRIGRQCHLEMGVLAGAHAGCPGSCYHPAVSAAAA